MKQLAQGASLVVETRRLLRHLDEPKSLRTNSLVAHLFEGHAEQTAVAATRALVHQALDAMVANARYARRRRCERFRDIIIRFDMSGESADVVASDLGLSVRHFYRERRLACLEIGTLLRQRAPKASSRSVISDIFEVSESAASSMVLSGAPLQGLDRFLSLASQSSQPLQRIAALCDAALIMVELYEQERARDTIAEARRILDENGLSLAARHEARDHIDFARALTGWDAKDPRAAVALAHHTMARASQYIHEMSASGLRRHATERMRHASRKLAEDDPVAALALLHDSEPLIDALDQRARFLRVDYANIRCGVELRTPGTWDEAACLASDAYDEARKQGYLVGAATALKSLAIMLAHRRDPRAEDLIEALLQLVLSNGSPRMLAYAQIGAADVYAMLHRYERALTLTRCAMGSLHGEPLQIKRAKGVEARALRGLRGEPAKKLSDS